ncbi:NAD(P)/FAD-dependent oxidoreductase [Corynebacterium sp. YIM 101645]|uniref:NAD(P)/FAD-dependent oxidoreductase n=1 Tax=Corynebacterium lemuris TaxID=1859292 RepID=A0ABT2FWZ4_9CORY|nr:NAD(P)/FAD-dependent oxidoreductase [Corynebacterium lemuris]MCS5479762.1 NAD(P)/FAD-dependent oxidoreductase [Corynebacterium lemuris]
MSHSQTHDVIVIGAGFAGLYSVHKLRDQMGLDVTAFEAASGVGGTWFWNRYPGARCDIESIHYSYSFSEELQQEWNWSERYAGQPEILDYLNHVADRFDLRRNIQFNTRVTSMVWDEENSFWRVGTDDGKTTTARYVISGAGNLSVPKKPDFPGVQDFQGDVYVTGNWPQEPVDFTGKRVGVIGTGSSGIQAITEIAKQAGHLTVFQRTPNFATPIGNGPIDPELYAEQKARYAELRKEARNHVQGVPLESPLPSAIEVSEEKRKEVYDKRYTQGGFRMFLSTFADIYHNKASNDTAADYIRGRIKERVKDPAVAELLSPTDHPYAAKRPAFENGYFEAFNRDNVELVDVKSNPIERVTTTGLNTTTDEYEFDVLVLATGFDAMTGPLMAMGIVGKNGERLQDKWADGPETYLGITVNGFPNLFLITGPQSPSVLYNMPLAIEDHVDFATAAIAHLNEHDLAIIEADAEAEKAWVEHANEKAAESLLPEANSWFMGSNIPGKPRRCLVYVGGAPTYRAICDEVVAAGYRGFELSPALELAQA